MMVVVAYVFVCFYILKIFKKKIKNFKKIYLLQVNFCFVFLELF